MANIKTTKDKTAWCNECLREYPINRFYDVKCGFSPKNKTLFCKDCVKDIVHMFLKNTGTIESAMWFTCAKLDIPFIRKVFESTESNIKAYQKRATVNEKTDEDYDWFMHYMSYLWGDKSMQKKTDIWNDFTNTDVQLGEIQVLKKSEELLKQEYQKFELDWGKQSVEDYQYLEYRWDYWTSDQPLDKAQEVLYRQICLLELRKRKKESQGDFENGKELGDSTKEEQDLIIKLMDKLKISNFEEHKDKTEFDLLLEKQIFEHEKTKPCEVVDLEYYKDLCNIESNWGKHILRAVRNLLAGTKDYPKIEKER